LERIPSSVVVHKRVDSSDTRLLQQTAELKDNPLEHNLGFFDFGKYHKAADDANFAFEKVGDLTQMRNQMMMNQGILETLMLVTLFIL
jgi:hypothetical protein